MRECVAEPDSLLASLWALAVLAEQGHGARSESRPFVNPISHLRFYVTEDHLFDRKCGAETAKCDQICRTEAKTRFSKS